MDTAALISAAAKYQAMGFNVDSVVSDLIRRDNGPACGKGWQGTKPGCTRAKKKEGSKTSSKESSKAAPQSGMERAISDRLEAIKQTMSGKPSDQDLLDVADLGRYGLKAGGKQGEETRALLRKARAAATDKDAFDKALGGSIPDAPKSSTTKKAATKTKPATTKASQPSEQKSEEKVPAKSPNVTGKVEISERDDYGKVSVKGIPSLDGQKETPERMKKLVDYHTAPMPGSKSELGKAYELRQGKPIKSLDEFKAEASKAIKSLDDEFGTENLVPIYKVRRALGDRVSRKDFTEFMRDMQADDDVQLVGGEFPENSFEKSEDSIHTRLGGPKYYVKRLKK